MNKIMDNFGVFDYVETPEGTYEYSAEEMRSYFAAIVGNGVLKGSGGQFAASAVGLTITLDTGEGWLLGVHGAIVEPVDFVMDPVASGLSRICSLVMDVDIINQQMGISVLVGTQAASPSAPVLTQTATRYQQLLHRARILDEGTVLLTDCCTLIKRPGEAATPAEIGALPYDAIPINILINGGFDVCRRGMIQTISGYGSDDKWANWHVQATKTHSIQSFPPGQTDVPNNPRFFSRTIVVSAGTSGSYCRKRQAIEDATRLSGKTVTVSFYAKADSARFIAVGMDHYFGTGGSDPVRATPTKISINTNWALYSVTITLPSVLGKTLGTGHLTTLEFWFDAGSDFSARTANLGNQSGTFDIANIQLNYDSVALPFVPRSYADELRLCQRYSYPLEAGDNFYTRMVSYNANTMSFYLPLPVQLRTSPTLTGVAGTDYFVLATNGVAQSGFTFTAYTVVGGLLIVASKISHGLTDGAFYIAGPAGGFDAEM